MSEHSEFVGRLRTRIAHFQGTDTDKISIARAAKDIGIPETTLRSTLQGRCPRSEDYWRKLRLYTRGSLDWLICGLGEPPMDDNTRPVERVLVVENDIHRLTLIRMALKGLAVDSARTEREASLMITENSYDLIMSGPEVDWPDEALINLKRDRSRPKLILLADPVPNGQHPFGLIADHTCRQPLEAQRITDLVHDHLQNLDGVIGPGQGH